MVVDDVAWFVCVYIAYSVPEPLHARPQTPWRARPSPPLVICLFRTWRSNHRSNPVFRRRGPHRGQPPVPLCRGLVRAAICVTGYVFREKKTEQGGWCMCLPMHKQPNLQSIQVRSNTTSCTTKRKSFFRFINGWVIGWHKNRHARFEWNCLWHLKINPSWWRIKKNTSIWILLQFACSAWNHFISLISRTLVSWPLNLQHMGKALLNLSKYDSYHDLELSTTFNPSGLRHPKPNYLKR
jgi:hypothetical protein